MLRKVIIVFLDESVNPMKKVVCFCVLFIFIACSSDDTTSARSNPSSDNFITSFKLNIGNELLTGEINETSNEINFGPFIGAQLNSLLPLIEYSENATIFPSETSYQNFNNTVNYTVTAENGDTKVYEVFVENRPFFTENEILSFSFEQNGQLYDCNIDNDLNKITLDVEGLDLSAITPNITISEYATISPSAETVQDLNNIVNYTVTSEGGEQRVYEVDIFNRPISTERQILSFSVEDDGNTYEGVIDEVEKIIYIDLADLDLNTITPTIVISEYATISPDSNTVQDFNSPPDYVVTSESGETATYSLVVNEPEVSSVGRSFSGQLLFYTGAELIIQGVFINPDDNGSEFVLLDGVNEYPLNVTSYTSHINSGDQVQYVVKALIPHNVPQYSNYTLAYSSNSGYSEFQNANIDVAINGPSNVKLSQDSYNYNDIFLMNGTNLLSGLVIPSNGNLFIVENNNDFDIVVNSNQTEVTLTLDYFPFFPSYYGNEPEVKEIYPIDQQRRIGETIYVVFN